MDWIKEKTREVGLDVTARVVLSAEPKPLVLNSKGATRILDHTIASVTGQREAIIHKRIAPPTIAHGKAISAIIEP